jgi:amicoumacin kinase
MEHRSQAFILEKAAQRFSVPVWQLHPLPGGHYASVYQWYGDGKGYVLKILPVDEESDLQSMRSMLVWLAHLAARDVPVLHPVASRAGSLIEPIEHDGQTYLVSAYEKIPGVRAETLPLEQWDDALIQKLGQVMGRCHLAAEDYSPANPMLKRPDWDQAANCFNPLDDLVTLDSDILQKREQVLKIIESLPKNRDSYGLAHLDIHFANFIIDLEQGGIVLIDFDDCACDWYVMDVAMLLFDAVVVYSTHERQTLYLRFLDDLLKGYRT